MVTGSEPSGGTSTGGNTNTNSDVLDTAQRQVIYQVLWFLSRLTQCLQALAQVQTIAQSLGGLVDSMSSNGEQDQQQATVTHPCAQEQFFTTLDKLESLGTVQSQNITSQDVTQQYVDLQARFKSSQAEEQNLLAILAKAQTVSDEISIQKQLTQVRSQIEAYKARSTTSRTGDMATITVTLNTPTQNIGQPPSAQLTVAVSNVEGNLTSIKQLMSRLGGVVDSSTISLNNGKESASLSVRVSRLTSTR